MQTAQTKLTELERESLERQFNLADGHARQTMPEFWNAYASVTARDLAISQASIESDFIAAYNGLLTQRGTGLGSSLIVPSASLSLEIVANFLRLKRMRLLAPTPCFDNVIDIFRRHGVPLSPYDCEEGSTSALVETVEAGEHDVILLVAPGNPTGTLSSAAELEPLLAAASRSGTAVILDVSFRAFSEDLATCDLYALLDQAGVEYAVVEDTGKFLAGFELKASILSASGLYEKPLGDIFTDVMISHSPLVLTVLTRVLDALGKGGLEDIRSLVQANRMRLEDLRLGEDRSQLSTSSVAWITLSNLSERDIADKNFSAALQILPGQPFYWQGVATGRPDRVRIALLRDQDYFRAAVEALRLSLPRRQVGARR